MVARTTLRQFTVRIACALLAPVGAAIGSIAYAVHEPSLLSIAVAGGLCIAAVVGFVVGSKLLGRRIRGSGAQRRISSHLSAASEHERVVMVSIIALPLGGAVAMGPSSQTQLRIARLNLHLRDDCSRVLCPAFGDLRLSETECQHHPAWKWFGTQGYILFLPKNELKEFRPVE